MDMHFGGKEKADYESIVDQYANSEFVRLSRSTVPMLVYWRKPQERLVELFGNLGWRDVEQDGTLFFEYPVKSVGRAKASFTDIMYVAGSAAMGIEAKSTEKRYKAVDKWLAEKDDPTFRREVLDHWLEHIRSYAGGLIEEEHVNGLPYQMIHRTASVCSLRKRHAAVLYQVFRVNGHTVDYKRDLEALAKAIGADRKIGICLHEVTATRTAAYDEVDRQLKQTPDGEAKAELIRNAILDGELFDFRQEKFVQIA